MNIKIEAPESNEIVKRMMDVAIDKEIEGYEKNLTILATIGSVAPFVGLFWNRVGYNEFFSINCNLEKY